MVWYTPFPLIASIKGSAIAPRGLSSKYFLTEGGRSVAVVMVTMSVSARMRVSSFLVV